MIRASLRGALHGIINDGSKDFRVKKLEMYTGLLASRPQNFTYMGDVVQTPIGDAVHGLASDGEFTLTNRGIRIRLPTQVIDHQRSLYLAFLACGRSGTIFALPLQQISDDRYTRFSSSTEMNDIIEIDEVKPNDIGEAEFIFVDQHKVSQRTAKMSVAGIDLTPLRNAFQRWNFHPEIGQSLGLFLDAVEETFVIVKNQDGEAVLMLVITSSKERHVGVQAVALGANDGTSQASSRQIYETWRNGQNLSAPLHSSHCSVAKMPNGQDIEFVAIQDFRAHQYYTHYILAVPRSSSEDGVFLTDES